MTTAKANTIVPFSASSQSPSNHLKGSGENRGSNKFHQKERAKLDATIARAERKMQLLAQPALKLFTQSQLGKLQKNFSKNNAIVPHSPNTIDFKPVVKLFTPDAPCTWLLTELDPDHIAFGLCDLGLGEPEIGYVDLKEIHALRGKLGLPVERDRGFVAERTLSEYAELARRERSIKA